MIRTSPVNHRQAEGDLKSLLDMHKKDIFLSFNCHAIATIQSFNPSNLTVNVTLNYKRTFLECDPVTGVYSSVLVDYPMLIDCPIYTPQGGDGSLTMPIAQGDTCLILFNDRDIDNWFSTGQVGPLASSRMHSFTDGIALIGIRPATRPISNYDTQRAVLRNGSAKVGLGKTKIVISNDTRSLNSLLQDLVTQVKALANATASLTVTCTGAGSPSSPPINAATLTAVSTQLTTVANQIGELLE